MAKLGPRDSQRSRVYAWEVKKLWNTKYDVKLSLFEAKELAEAVFGWFLPGVKHPDVVVNNRRKVTCAYKYTHNRIELSGQGWGHTFPVVAHELAHAMIDGHGLIAKVQWHGPEFMYYYGRIFEEFGGLPFKDFRRMAALSQVRVASGFDPAQWGKEIFTIDWPRFSVKFRADSANEVRRHIAGTRFKHTDYTVSSRRATTYKP